MAYNQEKLCKCKLCGFLFFWEGGGIQNVFLTETWLAYTLCVFVFVGGGGGLRLAIRDGT